MGWLSDGICSDVPFSPPSSLVSCPSRYDVPNLYPPPRPPFSSTQHANATGHYAGHPDPAPHLVDEQPQSSGHRKGLLSAFPRTNDEETWLRAAQPTDKNGVAEFTSIFPGYYTGRATREFCWRGWGRWGGGIGGADVC